MRIVIKGGKVLVAGSLNSAEIKAATAKAGKAKAAPKPKPESEPELVEPEPEPELPLTASKPKGAFKPSSTVHSPA